MPKTEKEETRQWISEHYGPVHVSARNIHIATVPVMGGVAVGLGFTEAEALESLYKDLTYSPDKSVL